jgi:hypothetical protein
MCNVAGMAPQTCEVPGVALLDQSSEGDKREAQCRGLLANWDHLFRHPRMRNQEVTASDILLILQDLWARADHEELFPEMCLRTVRRMLSRWG